jgi:hypothetical protein
MKRTYLLLIFCLLAFSAPAAFSQSCPGSYVTYIVRDKRGKVMNAADPKITFSGEEMNGRQRWRVAEKGFTRGRTFKLPAELEPLKEQVAGIYASEMCNFRAPLTLKVTMGGKTMELKFNFPRMGSMDSAQFLVDSLPFKPGRYEITLNLIEARSPGYYPANGWKKIG